MMLVLRRLASLALVTSLTACGARPPPTAATAHAHGHASRGDASRWSTPFVASRERPFAEQMMETMARMETGMSAAATTGDPDRDFVTMMIPHHQGAIDMAKVLLIHGTDPEMRRLAQSIITEQQNEIELMQLWLQRHEAGAAPAKGTP